MLRAFAFDHRTHSSEMASTTFGIEHVLVLPDRPGAII